MRHILTITLIIFLATPLHAVTAYHLSSGRQAYTPSLSQYYFTVLQSPQEVSYSSETVTDRDVTTVWTTATVSNIVLNYTGSLEPQDTIRYESLDPSIAYIDGNLVKWVSNGIARIHAKSRYSTKAINVPVSSSTDPVSREYLPGTLGAYLRSVFDSAAGWVNAENCSKACSSSTCSTCLPIQLFSTYNNSTQTYAYDPAGWAYGFDLTPAPVAGEQLLTTPVSREPSPG